MSPEDALQLLGLPLTASPEAVRLAWRQLAAQHHPDRGGDAAQFQAARAAYEVALAHAQQPKLCPRCEGRGKVMVFHGWSGVPVVCPDCQGGGRR